jgi:hypothetical protein
MSPNSPEAAAIQIAKSIYSLARRKRIVPSPTGEGTLSARDRKYQARMREFLSAQGFSALGYFEYEGDADSRPFAVYCEASGQIGAIVTVMQARIRASWWVKLLVFLRGKNPKPVFYFALGTRFADGADIETSNGSSANIFTTPPQYDLICMPKDTDPGVQLATHRKRVAARLRSVPAPAVEVRDTEAFLRLCEVGRLEREAYRRSIDYVTEDELRALCRDHYEVIAPLIRTELSRLAVAAPEAAELH